MIYGFVVGVGKCLGGGNVNIEEFVDVMFWVVVCVSFGVLCLPFAVMKFVWDNFISNKVLYKKMLVVFWFVVAIMVCYSTKVICYVFHDSDDFKKFIDDFKKFINNNFSVNLKRVGDDDE